MTQNEPSSYSFALARRSLVDATTVLLAGSTLGALVLPKRLPEPLVIVAAGALGIVIRSFAP